MPSLIPPLQSIWGVERGDSQGDNLGNTVEQVKAAIWFRGDVEQNSCIIYYNINKAYLRLLL